MCRIKRCDNLYSEEEILIRFIIYFPAASLAICKVLKQNTHTCGLSENSLFCIFMIFDDVWSIP